MFESKKMDKQISNPVPSIAKAYFEHTVFPGLNKNRFPYREAVFLRSERGIHRMTNKGQYSSSIPDGTLASVTSDKTGGPMPSSLMDVLNYKLPNGKGGVDLWFAWQQYLTDNAYYPTRNGVIVAATSKLRRKLRRRGFKNVLMPISGGKGYLTESHILWLSMVFGGATSYGRLIGWPKLNSNFPSFNSMDDLIKQQSVIRQLSKKKGRSMNRPASGQVNQRNNSINPVIYTGANSIVQAV